MYQLWQLAGTVALLIMSILLTFVFCFWFVYLLDTIRRKWKFYKNELRCLQQGTNGIQQQTLAYNAKTELVKNIMLFFLNLIEWIAFIIARMGYMIYFAEEFFHHSQSLNLNADPFPTTINNTNDKKNRIFVFYSIYYLANIFFVLSLVLMACLCMYLAARIARKSWIKSNRIPHLISFFLICCIVNQILASFCCSHIFANWFTTLLIIASFYIALKQYRKLQMVIGWSIVDLFVCRKRNSMAKLAKTKIRFRRFFTLLCIGILLLSFNQLITAAGQTYVLIFRMKNSSLYTCRLSLCVNSHFSTPAIALTFKKILIYGKFAVGLVGASFIFIPYILYGLYTMSIMLWRLYKGKTGYKTHFHNHMYAPLV